MKKIDVQYDFVVIGGGMAGICAAIAAARHGAKTALIHNRPVLGGNASSEIRMHICGADQHAANPNMRETGILEELLLENKYKNPNYSYSLFDTILWEKTHFQKNLDLYLNTHFTKLSVKNGLIKTVTAKQLTTEKTFVFSAPLFMDCTGNGTVGVKAGAEFMFGREAHEVFGDTSAPLKYDERTMGNSLMFESVDRGYPVRFIKPDWAYSYTEKDLALRDHSDFQSGYWWIELGGGHLNTIEDGEEIRDELVKVLFGVWDHIKNGGDHGAENHEIVWMGFLPGMRESYRLTGDYVLKQEDCVKISDFKDSVAYGGWAMDVHVSGGFEAQDEEATIFHPVYPGYAIPYRALYSKNIKNLYLGGRNISASHVAFGSTRVMATCAVMGQAAGTAAAVAIREKISPKAVMKHMDELQQTLLRDDCYIPLIKNHDINDIAAKAEVTASSCADGYLPENVINGTARNVREEINGWMSNSMSGSEWLRLKLDSVHKLEEVHVKFDSNLSKQIMISYMQSDLKLQVKGLPHELVKEWSLVFEKGGKAVLKMDFEENYQRFNKIVLPKPIECDSVKVEIHSTYGDSHARIFEMRLYENQRK